MNLHKIIYANNSKFKFFVNNSKKKNDFKNYTNQW
jgi:hypothetical protein